ncbi:MAG TPA: 1-acyl-sn-glycerol-3-phosphate acyltransferase, partial [Myxococcales bacterium]|nr:1-acyl-sn-glycerol-3-phosphate acyltransferase [Myxococcales bacterium]
MRNLFAVLAGISLLLYGLFPGDTQSSHAFLFLGSSLLALVVVARIHRKIAAIAILHLIKEHPDIHPADLWEYIYNQISIWPIRGPVVVRRVDYPVLDLRQPDRPLPNGRLMLMRCFIDTACIASLTIQLFKRMDETVSLEVFDSLARLWSSRCAQHLRLRLEVSGYESLKLVTHQSIIVLNHESLLDFALGFYGVGGAGTGRGNRLRPRFIAAKDHFKDNFFLHSVIGMGRAMDQAGMIFVDRKTKGAGRKVISESVAAMRKSGVDLAIFPQGTRASAHFDANEKPTGAGFYTTTRAPVAGVGHFKPGTARIAAELSQYQEVDIVLVAILGTATAIPAKRFDVYPGATISYHIAPPITVKAEEQTDAVELNQRIELAVRKNARVHPRLLTAWQEQSTGKNGDLDALTSALQAWDEAADPVPFATLDVILSHPAHERPA